MNTLQIAALGLVIVILGWPFLKFVFGWAKRPSGDRSEEILMRAIRLRSELLSDSDAIEAFDKVIIPVCIKRLGGNDHSGHDS